MKKTSLFLLILVLIFSAFAGCNTVEPVESPEVTEIITEALTQEPTDEPAEKVKIVSTAPSVTEILFAIDCGDDIVGVDTYSNYPEAANEIEKVGDYSGFDVEKVVSLEPTIVFAGNSLQQEQIDSLEDLGINVLAVEPTGFEDITTYITQIGAVVGKEQEAEELNDSINAAIDEVKNNENIPEDRPSVYYVMSIQSGNWTSGEGSFINTAMEIAGGICVTAGSEKAWLDYPLEDLVLADPDILFVSEYVTEEDLLANETYAELTAVKEGKYYFINPDIIERPGPRITDALEILQGYIIGE